MILVKLTILVLIPSKEVGFDLSKTFHKVFILDLHEYLGYRGIVERR